MSFSNNAKLELCRVKTALPCCAVAELYGALLFSGTFTAGEIRVVTENRRFSARLESAITKLFGEDMLPSRRDSRGKDIMVYTGGSSRRIYEYFGYEGRDATLHLNAALTEEEHCRDAFIRGAFLAGGTVSDPEKNYHLELCTRHFNLSREVVALLLDMGFSPKNTLRKSTYILYFKDSGEIEAFLTRAGAPSSALALMEAKVEKDLRNRVNRKVNCETANIMKTVDAAQRQLESIRFLRGAGLFDALDDGLKSAAELREQSPEATLAELVKISPDGLSRSGLNHRLGRLVTIAEAATNETTSNTAQRRFEEAVK